MEFRILGPLEVVEDGRSVELGGARQRLLLALLLVRANEVVARDTLIDELWGQRPPDTARTALQVHISQLRKALGREVIVTQAPGYVVRLEPDQLDLERFQKLVSEARGEEPPRAAAILREALSSWRGPPLAGVEGDALARERLRLEELRLAALEDGSTPTSSSARHADLVPELDRLVRRHSLRERLRGQLMLALYRSGRQADALEVYRRGRDLLDRELGLEPGETLRELERRILQQDASLAPPAPPPATPRSPAGTVTFLFTDVEGSTQLVKRLGLRYPDLLAEHQLLLREAFARYGGQEMDTQGDAFFVAFGRAKDAVGAAVAGQRGLSVHTWPEEAEVRVRMGLHTGEPELATDRYTGLGVHRASRICDAGHGGQILLSNATRELIEDDLPPKTSLRDLGTHRLKDIDRPERIYQLVADGLPSEFPPLRTVQRMRRRAWALVVAGAVILAGVAAALVVTLAGGGSSPVEVVPNSVAVVDAKTSRVVADIPVGVRPVAVAIGKDGVWVVNSGEGTVSRIDPEARKVVSTIGGVGQSPEDVALGAGSVWVANGSDGTVSQIDPRVNAVVATLDLRGPDKLAPNAAYAVAVGFGSLWVASGSRSVLRIDPDTGVVLKRIDVGGQAVAVEVGVGGVWAATTGERAVRIEPRANEVLTRTAVGGSPITLAVGAGAAWVGELDNKVWLIDADTGLATGTIAFQAAPTAIGVGKGTGWIAVRGTISRVDPDGIVLGTIGTGPGHSLSDLAVGPREVWVVAQPAEG